MRQYVYARKQRHCFFRQGGGGRSAGRKRPPYRRGRKKRKTGRTHGPRRLFGRVCGACFQRDYDFGYTGAKWLCEQLGGEGNIVCLDGMPGLSSAVLRMEGAMDAFSEYPGIKVIASEYANWDYATAKPIMENILAAYDDIDGIWSSGGDMTRAAIEVWADSGRDWIPMMGEDCNGFLKLWSQYKPEGLSCIAVSLPSWLFAYGAELGIQILDGTYDGPKDIIVDIPTITDDEVDDYVRWDLSDSFWGETHMSEEDIVALYGEGRDGSQGVTGTGAASDH